MNRIAALLATLVLAPGLSACGQSTATPAPAAPTVSTASTASTASTGAAVQAAQAAARASAQTATNTAPTRYHADPLINELIRLGRSDSQVKRHLRLLLSNFGPRLTGSHALMDAEAWSLDQFASFGLKARLERWGSFPVGFDRGPQSGKMTAPVTMELDFITPAWTPGVFGPHEGPALAYPLSLAAAKRLRPSVKGAWIVHTTGVRKLDGKLRKKIDAVLSKAGAAGHILRARDPKGQLVHTFGRYAIKWNKLPSAVRIYLRGDQHADITTRLHSSEEVRLSFSIDNQFFKGPVPQHNVIADIIGSEKPDEYVIVGGHLDSWDGADGAVDNGTGIATTLEAARLLMKAGAKPKRTIRFMLWSGEEQGLLGSTAYVEAHSELMPKISAVFVHDGGTNYLSGLSVTPEMAKQAKHALAPLFDLHPKMSFGLYHSKALRPGGSDHTPFIRAGVPGFFWHQAGRADYSHAHHTQYDTVNEVVPEYQEHSALVVALAALGLANEDRLLDRTDSAPLTNRRRLGVQLDGATITELTKKSNAKRLDMRAGDVIVEINGKKTEGTMDVVRGLRGKGEVKKIKFRRGKKLRTVTLDFGAGANAGKQKARAERRAKRFGEIEFGKVFAGTEPPKEDQPRWRAEQESKRKAAAAHPNGKSGDSEKHN